MTTLLNATTWTTALACAVMGGVYFTFSSFVMPSLAALPTAEGVASMQSINRVILSSSFMPLFFASTLAALALGIWGAARWGQPGAWALMLGGVVYVVGMFVCTAGFNVPLNDALEALEPESAAAAKLWAVYLRDWTWYNSARTLASVAAGALFFAAAWLGR